MTSSFYWKSFSIHNNCTIALAMACAISGGTALPICLNIAEREPSKKKSSGNDCILAASRIEIDLIVLLEG